MGAKRDNRHGFWVTTNCDDEAVKVMFSYLRLAAMDKAPEGGASAATRAISRDNEAAALKALRDACKRRLQDFDTSIAEDEALLREGTVPDRLRGTVVVRKGEKEVLQYYIDLADHALAILESTSPSTRFAAYFQQASDLLLQQPQHA